MSQNITFNGNGYVIPDLGEINWGQNLTDFFVSIPAGALQPTGGGFTLTAEVDFGGAFGLKSIYYKSRTTNPAAAGAVRLANTDTVSFRNAANSADLTLGVNGSNQLTFNGVVLESDTLPSGDMFVGNASNSSTARTISGAWTMDNLGVATLSSNYITNAMINAAAAIAYSKLNLTGSIVNADINAAAAIAYSKLNLSASIVNADVNASAAIAYSKLNLVGGIVNADINVSAAIAFSKMAALAASRMLVSSSAGVVTDSLWSYSATDDLTTGPNDELRFQDTTGGQYVGFRAPATVTTHTYDLPIAAGTAGQVLSWQAGGQLQWINAAGGGTINTGAANYFTYYPASGTTVDDQDLMFLSGNTIAISKLVAGGGVAIGLSNLANTATTDAATIAVSVGGALAGDPLMYFNVNAVNNWAIGLDNSDGDKFKIANNYEFVGVNEYFVMTTAGNITLAGQVGIAAGSAASPSYSFSADTNTGFYSPLADNIGISTGGVLRWTIDGNGTMYAGTTQGIQFPNGSAAIPAMNFTSDTDSGWFGLADNSMRLSLGGTQRFIFDTGQFYTPDGSTSLPAWTFVLDSNTGIYRSASDTMNFVAGGSDVFRIDTSLRVLTGHNVEMGTTSVFLGSDGSAAAPSYSFQNDTNTGFFRGTSDRIDASIGGTSLFQFSLTGFQTQIQNASSIITQSAFSGGILGMVIDNSSNTASSASRDFIRVAGSSAGDPYTLWNIAGVTSFAMGLDNSDGDKLKISNSSDLGTNDRFIIDTSGNIAMGANATIGPAFSIQDNSASDLRFLIYKNNSTGDPFTNWSTDTTNWSAGIDNSDSDKWKLNNTSSLAVGSTLEINLSNQLMVLDGSVSLPTLSFSNDQDTGFYRVGANQLGVAVGAAQSAQFNISGATDGTTYTPLLLFAGNQFGGGGAQNSSSFQVRTTASVSTTATTIGGTEYGIAVISGATAGGANIFTDLVIMHYSQNATVVASKNSNSPAARTYSLSGDQLQLAMASGTYNISYMLWKTPLR